MKASELRIGNFVGLENSEWDGFSYLFEMMDNSEVKTFLEDKNKHAIVVSISNDIELKAYGCDLDYYSINEIIPIQLTEEILLRFGFEKKQCGSGSYKYVNGIIEMHNYGGSTFKNMEIEMRGAFDAENDEDVVNVMFPYDVIYAHDLQNIYKMFTNEELTFKQ